MYFRLFERTFVIALFLSTMGVVDSLTKRTVGTHDLGAISTEVPMVTAVAEAAVYMTGACLLLLFWKRVFNAAYTVWPLIALAALGPLSTLWSVSPLLTLRRGSSLLISTLIGVYLGERFSIDQLTRMLAHAFCVMITAVSVIYVVAPSRLVDELSDVGALKGLSVTKNAFGGYMAIAVALLLVVKFHRFNWLRYLFLLAALGYLWLSHSATSLIVCALMIAFMPLLHLIQLHRKWRPIAYTTIFTTSLLLVYLVWSRTDFVLHSVGRDLTLSGRTQLWSSVAGAIGRHPLLGYGYGAFWSGMKGEALDVWVANKWLATAADNGYLELCLSLGLLGLSVFVCVLVISFQKARLYLWLDKSSVGIWPLMYLIFFTLHNVCESHLLTTRALDYLIFVAITTALAQYQRRTSLQPSTHSPAAVAVAYNPTPLLAMAAGRRSSFQDDVQ